MRLEHGQARARRPPTRCARTRWRARRWRGGSRSPRGLEQRASPAAARASRSRGPGRSRAARARSRRRGGRGRGRSATRRAARAACRDAARRQVDGGGGGSSELAQQQVDAHRVARVRRMAAALQRDQPRRPSPARAGRLRRASARRRPRRGSRAPGSARGAPGRRVSLLAEARRVDGLARAARRSCRAPTRPRPRSAGSSAAPGRSSPKNHSQKPRKSRCQECRLKRSQPSYSGEHRVERAPCVSGLVRERDGRPDERQRRHALGVLGGDDERRHRAAREPRRAPLARCPGASSTASASSAISRSA